MADLSLEDLDIAIAHWHVNAWGGAEYPVTQMADVLDVGTVYTLGTPSPDTPNPYGDVSFQDVCPHCLRGRCVGSKAVWVGSSNTRCGKMSDDDTVM